MPMNHLKTNELTGSNPVPTTIKKIMVEYYYRILEGRLFTKDGREYPKYGVGGLRYRSTYSIKELIKLEVGDKTTINGAVIQRVR